MHPGMPCARINSDFYIFLYHHHYVVNSIHEGFHLPLSEYTLPQAVVDNMAKNKERGLVVEIYDPKKHYGIDEFCEAINNPGFAAAIKNNLKREQPRPFLVAAHNGKVVGWTGAMYVEPTGRGHLDGICVDPAERKSGLGKALFCYLCANLKEMGASYMTFFTGLDNPARYIYLFAGFKIAQSFADMKKELK
jgi:N-acetylglutamate synthase-like GNAT family acetyltransferase